MVPFSRVVWGVTISTASSGSGLNVEIIASSLLIQTNLASHNLQIPRLLDSFLVLTLA
jgi:hypothetical protein